MVELAPPTFPKIPGPVRGFVSTAPAGPHSPMQVIVPSFSAEHSYELRRWQRRGETLPVVGDEVLVVEDENGVPWGAAWWPQSAEPAAVEPFIPAAKAFNSGTQSIPNATLTALTFDTDRFDNAAIHSTSSNTSRFVAPKAGVYSISAFADFATNAAGERFLAIRLNGSATKYLTAERIGSAFGGWEVTCHVDHFLEGGDYVEVVAFQSSGGALATSAQGSFLASAEASMVYLGSTLAKSGPTDWGIVTALPGAATVGDRCSYKWRETEAQPWKLWELQKVEEGGSFPWAFSGGPPMEVEDETARVKEGTTYTAIAGTMELTLPLKGIYDMEFGGRFYSATAGAACETALGYNGTVDESHRIDSYNAAVSSAAGADGRRVRKEQATAGVAVKMFHQTTVSTVFNMERRWAAATPARVG